MWPQSSPAVVQTAGRAGVVDGMGMVLVGAAAAMVVLAAGKANDSVSGGKIGAVDCVTDAGQSKQLMS